MPEPCQPGALLTKAPVFGERIQGIPFIKRPSAYALVRNSQGELATARTKRGWFLPGGGIDAGETAETAVARETVEECGLIIQPTRLIGRAMEIVHVPKRRACVGKDSFFFEADLLGQTAGTEKDHELEWLDIRRAIEQLTDRSHRWAAARLG